MFICETGFHQGLTPVGIVPPSLLVLIPCFALWRATSTSAADCRSVMVWWYSSTAALRNRENIHQESCTHYHHPTHQHFECASSPSPETKRKKQNTLLINASMCRNTNHSSLEKQRHTGFYCTRKNPFYSSIYTLTKVHFGSPYLKLLKPQKTRSDNARVGSKYKLLPKQHFILL